MLTTLQIKSAKPAERAYKLADTGGLFVLVQPNGSKLWRYKHAARLRQHLLSTRRTVLAIDIAHQQRIDGISGRSGRQRHGELRSVSGGIARDRSTTAQRSSQGSQTAAGRKRSPRERADLDGENDVVAWVDTASPTPHATIDVLET